MDILIENGRLPNGTIRIAMYGDGNVVEDDVEVKSFNFIKIGETRILKVGIDYAEFNCRILQPVQNGHNKRTFTISKDPIYS